MILVRRVEGDSMLPSLRTGDTVIARRGTAKVGSIVIAKVSGREVIKRVEQVGDGWCYIVGDNPSHSTDSRHYGKLSKSDILGIVMMKLPEAVIPPKLVKPYGIWFGWSAALLLILLALVHLFRIDTFVPLLDMYLPGGRAVAGFAGVLVILSEIFAIPFLLRMKLSPLAHLVSGALVVLAPLWWILIDIWTYGTGYNTGQLGEFVVVVAAVLTLIINLLWLGFNYLALYLLGYNRLKLPHKLSK